MGRCFPSDRNRDRGAQEEHVGHLKEREAGSLTEEAGCYEGSEAGKRATEGPGGTPGQSLPLRENLFAKPFPCAATKCLV